MHVSSDYEGFWIMLCKVIYEKLHYEKLNIPFGHVLSLSDDVYHGGCIGWYGSFRFHFAIKNKYSRAEELLVKNIAYLKTLFYQAFTSITKIQLSLVTPEIDSIIKKYKSILFQWRIRKSICC